MVWPYCRLKHSKFANGFEVMSLQESSNPNASQAAPGKFLYVRYKGTLPNGKVFDETLGNKRFGFRLGAPAIPVNRFAKMALQVQLQSEVFGSHQGPAWMVVASFFLLPTLLLRALGFSACGTGCAGHSAHS
jgi:hypothetical protein